MSTQLDILALEPFYGGVRRNMLETLMRCSRHRWTLLKLPPRRIERRLAAAAHWFAEQLTRHWVGQFDVLFTSEALNLADLYRLMPHLARKPSVVYFHDNQIPDLAVKPHTEAVDFANLNTASAATEMWFNSKFHIREFLASLTALVDAHEELASQDPVSALTNRIHYMPPPVDLAIGKEILLGSAPTRSQEMIFVETRDADMKLLNEALGIMKEAGDPIQLMTVGPVEQLVADFPRQALVETDVVAQFRAILQCATFASTHVSTAFDEHAIRALGLGCRPVLPRSGVYLEIIPKEMHNSCLYDLDPEALASRLQEALYLPPDYDARDDLEKILHQFDAMTACKAFDERLEQISHNPARL